MPRSFRVAFVIDRRLGADAWRAYFLAAHRFAHTRPNWEILREGGYTCLSWREAFHLQPDGVLATLEPDQPILPPPSPNTRVVVVNSSVATHPFDRVVIDGHEAGRRAAAHLIGRKLAHYAYVGWSTIGYSEEHQWGFRSAMQDAGLDASMQTLDLVGGGVDMFVPPADWFNQLPKPCGIVCANDGLAVRMVNACLAAGYVVPDDIAVMGIGDDEVLCVQSPVPLTSVAVDQFAQAYTAAECLDQWLRDKTPGSQTVRLPPGEVVERKSTCVFGEDDPVVRRSLVLIHAPTAHAMTVEHLLDLLGDVSRRRLEMLFRQRLGVTPYQEILRARIELAKRLLRSSSMSIDEIAYRAGFSSSAHFSRPFKSRVGKTPSRYREQHQTVSRRTMREGGRA